MSTVGNLVERIFRDYLTRPGDTPVQTKIAGAVNVSDPTVVYSADLELEEVDLITPGVIVEMGIELMRITDHDEDTRTLTWDKGVYGSTDAAHVAGTLLRVAPKPSRFMVFEAVADAIENLYPDLYAVGTEWGDPGDTVVELTASPAPGQILGATQMVSGEPLPVTARLVRSDVEFGTGVGIYYESREFGGEDVSIRFTKAFTRPTALTETLVSLGVETGWERIIIYDALAAFLISPDIDATTQEYLSEALSAEGFPATTGTDLSVALTRLRENEIRKARTRLRALNSVGTVYSSPV